ncbi:MAG: hypothetical protein ABS96_23805 [Lysobacteraceae bacterium SCN 69-123]|uniref:hypothetical protein n=1 Tax=Stenotrophomonas acidaminiphila TaxID=128780 RepID=UPI00086AA9D8|nr:hypothetical protein [Stenotrophomonas acidaminiphila]ODU42940.1 MAG: hypothetical protein ABS96_23805 [Xanthomonadaceae bacterium SCN 69-123]OJY79216.1 MAG: hypothetical protein BGP18_00080 [Stenotrophomonas sp. 69-14]
MNKPIALATAAILAALTSACASFSVTDDAIERNTAQALGLAKGTFTVTDRSNDGVKASYKVRTDSGKQYSCYVTGGVSITGRAVSDSICSELGKGGMSGKPATDGTCNALLKAAGKC